MKAILRATRSVTLAWSSASLAVFDHASFEVLRWHALPRVSHLVVSGLSGTMNIARRATGNVAHPSIMTTGCQMLVWVNERLSLGGRGPAT